VGTLDALSMDMSEDVMKIRNVGFRLLYETGEPVPVDLIAEHGGHEVAEVAEILARPDVVGRSRRDKAGRLVGIAGLSVDPTPHEIQIGERRMWTWCALDAVGIFTAMEETGVVYSTPPDGSGTLEIRFVNGECLSDPSLFILGGFDGGDSVESWCPSVNFFATADDATAWADGHHLEGEVVSIGQIAENAGAVWRPVVTELGPANG
jgi:alkylmercury lyase